MFERFGGAARTAVEDARYEAERRGDRRIGSDHLLLALLRDDELAQLVGVGFVLYFLYGIWHLWRRFSRDGLW